jgi:GNAT superfamily N-acetyltransferase
LEKSRLIRPQCKDTCIHNIPDERPCRLLVGRRHHRQHRQAAECQGSDSTMCGRMQGRTNRRGAAWPSPSSPRLNSLRSAEAADASRVAELVDAAYGHYVERIGMLPGPMTNDYADVIRNRQVTVAEHQGAIVGIIVLTVTDEGFLVDNVAVHPSHRGTGLGRALLQFAEAEAQRAGFDAIYLYTHEKMTENLALYARIGYVEYDRRSQGAFSRVYLRKHRKHLG